MKTNKQTTQTKGSKVFQPLEIKKLESIIGGPIASRGTVTNVQNG